MAVQLVENRELTHCFRIGKGCAAVPVVFLPVGRQPPVLEGSSDDVQALRRDSEVCPETWVSPLKSPWEKRALCWPEN